MRCFVVIAFMLSLFGVQHVAAQGFNVTGTVKDAAGEPLIGASVIVEGTSRGVAVGADGSYSIGVSSNDAALRFTYLGYTDQVITVGTQRVINVSLQEDATMIDEVIVIGYGTIKKSDVTGAVSHIGADEIRERPVQNALQAMQGRMPGVDITTNSRPGQLGDIRIRGNRSLNASNEPLYVIDGIPMGSGVGTGPNTAAIDVIEYSLSAGSMADINPADIESIDILKDASATAIYGSRGANGVVLITTKKGREGRTSVSYDGTTTFTWVKNMTDWMTSGELLDWKRQARINADNYSGARYGKAPDPAWDLSNLMGGWEYLTPALATAYQLTGNNPNTPVMRAATPDEIARGYAPQVPVYDSSKMFDNDWTKYVSRVARTDSHQLSVSGGTEKVNFYTSASYLNQQSTNLDQDYQRFSLNASGEVRATNWFKMGMSANLGHSVQNYGVMNNTKNGGAKDAYGQALNQLRWAPTFADENGQPVFVTGKKYEDEYALYTPGRDRGPSGHNMLNNIDKAFNENRAASVIASAYAEIQLAEGLRFRTNFGAQFREQRNGRYYAPLWSNPQGVTDSNPGWGYYGNTSNLSWTLENLIYYDKVFGDHSISATLLQSAEKFRTEMIWMRFDQLTYESAKWYNGAANGRGNPHSYNTSYAATTMASYMARFNYAFKNRYLLTLTGRYDGASMLAAGNKWDFFPSASFAWKIEEENFMKNQTLFNQLKLRVGYGETGNSSVNAYQTPGTLVGQNYLFDTNPIPGSKAQVIPVPGLGWERTKQWNVGLDFGILRNRIMGSIEYYIANTTDLLMKKSVPYASGYDSVWANLGQTRNSGIEVSLTTTNISRPNFSWKTAWSFTLNREQVIETQYGKVDDAGQNMRIGHPMRPHFRLTYDRLWQNTDEDRRMMAIYKALGGYDYLPGQTMVKDKQPMVMGTEGQEGFTTKDITWTDVNGTQHKEKVTYLNNGFGTIDDKDRSVIGSLTPDWVGSLTNTIDYKNWSLSFFLYARVGAMYNTLLQTYGFGNSARRMDLDDVWSLDNPSGTYPQLRDGGAKFVNYNDDFAYRKASFVAVRNIALSYQLPERLLSKLTISNAQVYAQVLNPFIWGGKLVKAGINPDDDGRGNGANAQSNNTARYQSAVIGLRFSF